MIFRSCVQETMNEYCRQLSHEDDVILSAEYAPTTEAQAHCEGKCLQHLLNANCSVYILYFRT